MTLSILIVSHNTKDKLRKCLMHVGIGHEVVVIDNASTDGSAEMVQAEFPHVRLIRNALNRGFGAANNQGLDASTGEIVLFLNSDAYVSAEAIPGLLRAFDDPEVIAAGACQRNPDGSLQDSCANELTLWAVFCEQTYLEKLFRRSPSLSPYWVTQRAYAEGLETGRPVRVAQVMGATLAMRRGERFDERYFLYCEDTDLCKRLSEKGAIVYVADAEIVHELGSSSSGSRWASIARYNAGKELYFRLHYGALASHACFAIDRLGAALRLGIWLGAALATLGLWGKARRQAQTFGLVLSAPRRGPIPNPPGTPPSPKAAPRP